MLIGKNIVLRSLKIEDIEKATLWRNDLELIKLTQGIRFPKTIEMEKAWFDKILNDISNKNIYFGIDEIVSNEFIGIIQLNNIDYISGTAIWGFILGERTKQRTGYGIEAQKLLFNYAFNILNIRKIYSYTIAFNKTTLSWLDKIGGFKEEGRLNKQVYFDGDYHDVVIMAFYKEDFINK